MCCMAEPKLYEILRWQIEQVHKHLQPDGYFLQHDEIRVQGWDESCRHTRQDAGRAAGRERPQVRGAGRDEDPGKPIYVWSDMFDPNHNAQKTGRYYLVKGDGPWYGSWQGLDKDVVIVNWNSDPDKRVESLRHFAESGPPADPGRLLRRAGRRDSAVGSKDGRRHPGDHRRDVHNLAAASTETWRHLPPS